MAKQERSSPLISCRTLGTLVKQATGADTTTVWFSVDGQQVVRPGLVPDRPGCLSHYRYGTDDPREGQVGRVVEVRSGDTIHQLSQIRVCVRWESGETIRYDDLTASSFRLAD